MHFKYLFLTFLIGLSLQAKDSYKEPPQIVLGNPDAKIEVIVYTALTCGACATLHKNILKSYVNNPTYRIVIRHYPLDSHSFQGAIHVECSSDKLRFYDAIFQKQNELIERGENIEDFFQDIAADLKIPLNLKKKDEIKQLILEDFQKVQRLIDVTPTFFLGTPGQPLETRKKGSGALSPEIFKKFLESVN